MIYASPSLSASLYRCGNTYQDTPCRNQAEKKPIRKIQSKPTSSQNGNQTKLPVSPKCAARGKAAQQIMWKREVGYTLEKQVEAEQSIQKKDFIANVYKHRGSSLHVKNAIEQACAEQEKKDQLAMELEAAAGRLRSNNGKKIVNKTELQVESTDKHNESIKETNEADIKKQESCKRLKKELASVNAQRKSGGSARIMNHLKKQQNKLIDEIRDEQCRHNS